MTNGTLETNGARPVIRFERLLPHSPDEVWQSLTDPEGLKAWFPTDIITDEWKIGATLTFVFRENEAPDFTGIVLELEEPHRLAYTWGGETLRFVLTPQPNGATLLVLTDELDGGIAARNAAGWEACLARLSGVNPPRRVEASLRPVLRRIRTDARPSRGPPSRSLCRLIASGGGWSVAVVSSDPWVDGS
jgi:uncharacterized protein YndB with AHSA1/START domain